MWDNIPRTERRRRGSKRECYDAFAVSASQIETVKAYIRNQREHHKKRSFEQEFVAMLKKARVPYDPKFVFG